MIEIFTGKPGGGKTYVGAVVVAMDELEFGTRAIVTNAAFIYDNLNAYYQRPGAKFVDVFSRLRLISTEEALEFWRFRGDRTVLPAGGLISTRRLQELERESMRGGKVNWYKSTGYTEDEISILPLRELARMEEEDGVLYIIDEAHVLFDARRWQQSAAALTFYNSQHRKLRDDCIMVTQFLKLLETRVKGFADRFHVMKNFTGQRLLTVLRMPQKMRELVYSAEPGPGAEVDREIWHTLDLKRAACYDTMAGVGLRGGRKAEKRRSDRGFSLPWWSVLVALAVLAVVFRWGMTKASSTVAEGFQKLGRSAGIGDVGENVAGAKRKDVKGHMTVAPAPALDREEIVGKSRVTERTAEPVPVYMLGYAVSGAKAYVELSDGRRINQADLLSVDVDGCTLRTGERINRAPRARGGKSVTAIPAFVPRGQITPQNPPPEAKRKKGAEAPQALKGQSGRPPAPGKR